MQRTEHTGWLWTVTVVGALLMFMAGITKLLGVDMLVDMLLGLNVPLWAIPVIGTIEVIGALLFIFPRTSFYGGLVLLAVLFGAFVTHILNADWAGMVQPVVPGVFVAMGTYWRRPRWVDRPERGRAVQT